MLRTSSSYCKLEGHVGGPEAMFLCRSERGEESSSF